MHIPVNDKSLLAEEKGSQRQLRDILQSVAPPQPYANDVRCFVSCCIRIFSSFLVLKIKQQIESQRRRCPVTVKPGASTTKCQAYQTTNRPQTVSNIATTEAGRTRATRLKAPPPTQPPNSISHRIVQYHAASGKVISYPSFPRNFPHAGTICFASETKPSADAVLCIANIACNLINLPRKYESLT